MRNLLFKMSVICLLACLVACTTFAGEATDDDGAAPANQSANQPDPSWADDDPRREMHELLQKEQTPEVIEARKEIMRKMYRNLAKSQMRNFKIKGAVVDESGAMLEGVTLNIEKDPPAEDPWNGSQSEHETTTVDGQFSFSFKGYQRISLSFSKEGYYSETFSLSSDREEWNVEQLLRISKGEIPPASEIEKDGIRITLQKMGELTKLNYLAASIELTPEGATSFADVQPHIEKWIYHVGPINVARPIEELEQLKPGHAGITLSVPATDGKLIVRNVGPVQHSIWMPQEMVLRMTAPGDGFILFSDTDTIYRQSRAMKKAPAEGYQQELVLRADEAEKWLRSLGRDKVWFYVKIGGRYGRGVIAEIQSRGKFHSEDGVEWVDKWTVRFQLRIQPDGSDNLETRW